MAHPNRIRRNKLRGGLVVGSTLTLLIASHPGLAQEPEDSAAFDAARIASIADRLTVGLPCSQGDTPVALENRLNQSAETLPDLADALELVSESTSQCAEVRAAAARQRLYIAPDAAERGDTGGLTSIGTGVPLAFEVGPPPLNLTRARARDR